MKVRQGFVSNSSSTNFMFFLKKDSTIETLCEKIRKYGSHFSFESEMFEGVKVSPEDIIEQIKSIENVRILPIEKLKKRVSENLAYWKTQLEATPPNAPTDDWCQCFIDDDKDLFENISTLEKKGLTTVIEIDFGDNNGDVSGGDVGNLMDYEGRFIRLDEPDFVVKTEQNR